MNQNNLSPQRIALAQSVNSGFEGTVPFTIHVHSHYPRCDEIFAWLIRNNIVGLKLLEWITYEHEGSQLKAVAHILTKIERDKEIRRVLFGRDFRS